LEDLQIKQNGEIIGEGEDDAGKFVWSGINQKGKI
jgi:hypothetical protein